MNPLKKACFPGVKRAIGEVWGPSISMMSSTPPPSDGISWFAWEVLQVLCCVSRSGHARQQKNRFLLGCPRKLGSMVSQWVI